MVTFFLSVGAALAFVIGGIFMKLSAGFADLLSSLAIYLCFGLGATFQTIAIGQTNLGGTYIAILGLEAVVTLLVSVWLFKEQQTFPKLLGLGLIVAGVALLRGSE